MQRKIKTDDDDVRIHHANRHKSFILNELAMLQSRLTSTSVKSKNFKEFIMKRVETGSTGM